MPPTDSTVEDLDDLLAASRNVRRRFEGDAYTNMAFYLGQQWTRWDGNQVYEVRLEDWREQAVDNRIGPFVRTEIAKMTKTRPKWVAVPRTKSDQDMDATRYAVLALDDQWKRQNLTRKLRQALLWSRVTGAGFWKVWWDSSLGPKKDVLIYGQGHPNAGRVVRDQYQAPMDPALAHTLPPEAQAQPQAVAMGDLCVELRSFFHIFPDPLCSEEGIEAAEWIAEEAVYSRNYVEQHFPTFADRLDYDADPMPGAIEARMPFGGLYDSSTTKAGKGVKLREYWSQSKHCVWAAGKLKLLEEANPYPWLPYVMFRGQPVPGRFWPHSVCTDLRPRQVDLNKRLSQIAENAERIGNPPLLKPSTMGDDFDWQGLPGEVIEFQDTGSPNAIPQFMGVPELPGYVQNDAERAENAIREISGQHEVSAATVPAGVTAASAISLLQEQDDTRLGPDVSEMEQTLTDAGRRMIWLIRHYYTDERHLRVSGEGGRWDVMAFKGQQLDGIEDVEVQSGSGMPDSKAARQSAIQQVLALIMQNNPTALSQRDLQKVMAEFEVGGLESMFAQVTRDEQQVEDENRRLAQGEPLPINPWDNDAAHVDFHQDFQKTSRFSALNPAIQQQFEAHVEQHRMRIAQANLNAQAPLGGPQSQLPPTGGESNGTPPSPIPAPSQ